MKKLYWLNNTILIALGVSFGFFPEITVLILMVLGISYLYKNLKNILFLPVKLPIPAFWLIPLLSQNPLQIILGFLLFFGIKKVNVNTVFKFSLVSGMILGIIYSVIVAFSLISKFEWVVTPDLATIDDQGSVVRFIAVNKTNAWVLQRLGQQGGIFQYVVEVRSDQNMLINMLILHEGLVGGHQDSPCYVTNVWSTCKIRVQTKIVRPAMFGFGSHGTWKAGDPALEVRNSRVKIFAPPLFRERLDAVSRVQGTSFNANAFGAWMAILGIIGVNIFIKWQCKLLIITLSLVGILLSGSRNAIIAFLFGVIMLLIAQSRYFKILFALFFLLISFLVFFIFENIHDSTSGNVSARPTIELPQFPGKRALKIPDHNSMQTRIDIFQLAFRAFLSSPVVGVGNLQLAMLRDLKLNQKKFELQPENITHAHNLWLQVAGERGILGLFAMFWLWITVAYSAICRRDFSAISLLTVIFTLNTVDYLFYYAPVFIAFWWCAAGFPVLGRPSVFLNRQSRGELNGLSEQ